MKKLIACVAAAGGLVVAGAAAGLSVPAQVQAEPATPATALRLAMPAHGGAIDEELMARLEGLILDRPLVLYRGSETLRTTPRKAGISFDSDQAVSEFEAARRRENWISHARAFFFRPRPPELVLDLELDEAVFAPLLAGLARRLDRQPKNAGARVASAGLVIKPGAAGRTVSVAATGAAILRRLASGEQAALLLDRLRSEAPAAEVELRSPVVMESRQPRITETQLSSVSRSLASFTTSLAGSSRNRIHNVTLAASAIDGTALLPGDTFSYNAAVGSRTARAGFRNAPVIINGEKREGIGGGICQVSSTLYNAALLANLTIISRRPHSRPVPYVPAGRDATVVDGAIDFRFKNNLTHPVVVTVQVAGRKLVTAIHGSPEDASQVEIVTAGGRTRGAGYRTIRDPRLRIGRRVIISRPSSGRSVTVSRLVRDGGKVLSREIVSRDRYPARQGLIRVGSARPAPRSRPRQERPADETPAGGVSEPDTDAPPALDES